MALDTLLFLIFSLLCMLCLCLGFSHVPGQGAEKSSSIIKETNTTLWQVWFSNFCCFQATRHGEQKAPSSSLLYLLRHHLLPIAFFVRTYQELQHFFTACFLPCLSSHSPGYTPLLRDERVSEWKCLSQPEIWLMYFIAIPSSSKLHERYKTKPQGYSSVKKLPLPILCHDDSGDKLMFWQHTGNVLKS